MAEKNRHRKYQGEPSDEELIRVWREVADEGVAGGRKEIASRLGMSEDRVRNRSISIRQSGVDLPKLTRVRSERAGDGRVIDYRVSQNAPGEFQGEEDGTEREGNRLEVSFLGDGPVVTEDDALKAHQIDLAKWVVEKALTKDWTTTMKVVSGAGAKRREQPVQVQNHGIRLTLVKRNPDPVEWPILQPAQVKCSRLPLASKSKQAGSVKTSLIVPDAQIGFRMLAPNAPLDPFHDRRAMDIAVQLAREERPDVIVLLGDWLDMAEWSDKYVASREMWFTSQAMLDEAAWWIGQLRQASPESEIVYIEGNHEERLTRYLSANIVHAVGLRPGMVQDGPPIMSIPHWLGLDELGVEYVGGYPDGEYWLNSNVVCVHGNRASNSAAKESEALLDDWRASVVYGHTHRLNLLPVTRHRKGSQVIYYAFSPGTLARIDGAVPAVKGRNNWQQGVGLVSYEPGNGLPDFRPVQIYAGRAVYGGTVFEGRDLNERIEDEVHAIRRAAA